MHENVKKNGYREFDHSGNSGTFKSFQFPISALYSVSNHAGDRDNTTNSHRYSSCLSLGGGYKGIDIMNVLTWSTDLLHFTCSWTENNMVLTKAYLRYVQSACFGVVCSLKANIVFVRRRNNKTSKQVILYAVCPTLESVVVWDVKRGEKVLYVEQTASKLSFWLNLIENYDVW